MKPHILTDQDWICPYCRKLAYNGQNKLRHLSSHEPCIRRLVRENFLAQLELTFRAIDFDDSNEKEIY